MSLLISIATSPVVVAVLSCALSAAAGSAFMYAALKAADKIKKSTDHIVQRKEN